MSRRDTIIIAVLINAGLLVVLFSTALKPSHSEEKEPSVQGIALATPQLTEIAVRKEPLPIPKGDEVDQVLSQFAQTAPPERGLFAEQRELPLSSIPPGPVEPIQKNDFVRDLNSSTLPQTPPSQRSVESSPIEVVVKKGDVLDRIARQHRTSVEEIMRLNKLTSTHLKIGQVLKVAPNDGKKGPAEIKSEGAKYYTVKNGDNPWTIAVKNHMKVEELLRLNHLDGEKARHLKPGDQLRIR
jgi:peptidoglycan DL-endopeptidase LytF